MGKRWRKGSGFYGLKESGEEESIWKDEELENFINRVMVDVALLIVPVLLEIDAGEKKIYTTQQKQHRT